VLVCLHCNEAIACCVYCMKCISKHYVIGHATQGPRDNSKVPRDSVVVREEVLMENQLTSPCPQTLSLKIFESAFCRQYDNYNYDACNCDEGAKEL